MWRYVAFAVIVALVGLGSPPPGHATGDLTKQRPIEVRVELGTAHGAHKFVPSDLRFETGKLYKLVLSNPSRSKHYFTSPGLARRVYTRKVQVVDATGVRAEIKGVVNEIEVYPGGTAEWWFVPVASGDLHDLHCHVSGGDGRTHADAGMRGTISIR
ncbi:MAG: hypothetical protein ACR2PO_17630 [Methyloligellaceae bacterium]